MIGVWLYLGALLLAIIWFTSLCLAVNNFLGRTWPLPASVFLFPSQKRLCSAPCLRTPKLYQFPNCWENDMAYYLTIFYLGNGHRPWRYSWLAEISYQSCLQGASRALFILNNPPERELSSEKPICSCSYLSPSCILCLTSRSYACMKIFSFIL